MRKWVDEKPPIHLSTDDVGSHVGDTALVLVADHADVALLTPRGTPGVLDNPVGLGAVSAVTNSEDTVVEVGTASTVEDTTRVELEAHLVSLNSNSNGDDVDSVHEVSLSGGDIDVARDLDSGSAALARAVASSVGVVRLSADTTVLLDPLEGGVHETTVATLVTSRARAVNELLLRERDKLAVLDEVSTLNSTSGGESPAGAALTLVLDGGDSTARAPVKSISSDSRLGGSIPSSEVASELAVDVLELVHLSRELLGGEVTELVDSNSVGSITLSVVSKNEVEVLLENVVASEELRSLVLLVVLVNKASEEELVLLLGERSSRNRCSAKRNDGNDGNSNVGLHPGLLSLIYRQFNVLFSSRYFPAS